MDHTTTFLSLPNGGWTPLQNALSRVHAAHAISAHKQQAADPTDSSAMNSLAQTMQIIWNQLPSDWRKAALCVIADGHKKQAEDLIAHGSGSSNNAAVQLEYCKYLVLHPHKEALEYVSVYKPLRIIHILSRTEEKDMCTVHQLEEENGGRVGVGPALDIQNNISHRDHLLALLLGIIGCLLVQWLFIER